MVESFASNIKSISSHLAGFMPRLQLLSATDGALAIAQIKREPVDLLIIDSCLRGLIDGFELCRALRSTNADEHIPIILILSSYLSLERCKGISAGADLLLQRPIVKEELIKMIQLLLGKRFEEMSKSLPGGAKHYAPQSLQLVS